MMDYIAGLVQRGLISSDVAQGLVQQVADLKQRPFETGGGAPTNSVYTPRGAGQPTEAPTSQYPHLDEWSGQPNETQLLKQRKRQIQYDQRLSYPNKEDRPPSGELNAINDRLGELNAPDLGGNLAGNKNMQGQLGKFNLPDLYDDFQAGLNDRQIADKYGVTRPAITQRRKAWGIEPKPRGRPWPSKETDQE